VLVIDHVVMLVPDADEMAATLRTRYGLGSERGPYHSFAGTRNHSVPLDPPSYLEFLTLENREAAARTEAGRRVLRCEQDGFGFLAWAVRVDDLEDVSRRLGIAVVDRTVREPDGTLRGWRTVTGPPHLPFFIDYPHNGDRVGRWREMYERVGHACRPGDFAELTIGGRRDETLEWLGPNELPLRFVSGRDGIRQVVIEASPRDLTMTWPPS